MYCLCRICMHAYLLHVLIYVEIEHSQFNWLVSLELWWCHQSVFWLVHIFVGLTYVSCHVSEYMTMWHTAFWLVHIFWTPYACMHDLPCQHSCHTNVTVVSHWYRPNISWCHAMTSVWRHAMSCHISTPVPYLLWHDLNSNVLILFHLFYLLMHIICCSSI